MSVQLTSSHGRLRSRWVAVALAIFFLMLISAPQCAAEQPTATAVITDRAALSASSKFSVANQFRLTDQGNVYFSSGSNTALFRWSQATGARKRLLQTNDPLEVLGLDIPPEEAKALAGSLLDATGALLQVNAAGYAAFIVSFAIKGEQDTAIVLVYDGSSYRPVDTNVSTYSQLFLNGSGRVAVSGNTGLLGSGQARICVETASGEVKTVAEQGQPAPVGGNYTTLQLIGFNDLGQAAFLADIQGGSTNRAVFLSDGGPPILVVRRNAPAPGTTGGTFNLRSGVGNYMLNSVNEVAFATDINGDGGEPGIWIGRASAPPSKVMRLNEATGTGLGGTFSINIANGPFALRGFNEAG